MTYQKIIPKHENADKGYSYTVTDEQLEVYAKWTLEERLQWIFETFELVSQLQTPVEKARALAIKHKPIGLDKTDNNNYFKG